MKLVITDGGRSAAGFKGAASDCVVRAIAIAADKPYREVYDAINAIAKTGERVGTREREKGDAKPSNAKTGVYKHTYQRYLESIGAVWTPTMFIGSGCKVHLREDELPKGRIVVSLSRHMAAVIDGVLHDAYDCSRSGTRCVYGYYKIKETQR